MLGMNAILFFQSYPHQIICSRLFYLNLTYICEELKLTAEHTMEASEQINRCVFVKSCVFRTHGQLTVVLAFVA